MTSAECRSTQVGRGKIYSKLSRTTRTFFILFFYLLSNCQGQPGTARTLIAQCSKKKLLGYITPVSSIHNLILYFKKVTI